MISCVWCEIFSLTFMISEIKLLTPASSEEIQRPRGLYAATALLGSGRSCLSVVIQKHKVTMTMYILMNRSSDCVVWPSKPIAANISWKYRRGRRTDGNKNIFLMLTFKEYLQGVLSSLGFQHEERYKVEF